MKRTWTSIKGEHLPVHSLNTLIIGSGAAALNAALCLHDFGVTDIAVATDRWGGGTSNNAGSDKQTYYKTSLAGELPEPGGDQVVGGAGDVVRPAGAAR